MLLQCVKCVKSLNCSTTSKHAFYTQTPTQILITWMRHQGIKFSFNPTNLAAAETCKTAVGMAIGGITVILTVHYGSEGYALWVVGCAL